MSTVKSIVVGLGVVAGIALGAQAQTVAGAASPGVSVASLPPAAGPRASSVHSIPSSPHQAVAPSGRYPGPKVRGSSAPVHQAFQNPADWDSNTVLHPYTSAGSGVSVGGGR